MSEPQAMAKQDIDVQSLSNHSSIMYQEEDGEAHVSSAYGTAQSILTSYHKPHVMLDTEQATITPPFSVNELKGSLLYTHIHTPHQQPSSLGLPSKHIHTQPYADLHNLDAFTPVATLGRGNMGTVILVVSKQSGCPFALKVAQRSPGRKKHKAARTGIERDILSTLHHPFLQTLHTHFESGQHSLLLLDFCSGGDLNVLRHRQPEKRFSETAARFYAAEVLLALEQLHKLGIVYRDLKPENILVQASGHIKLTDFDLSLKVCNHTEEGLAAGGQAQAKTARVCSLQQQLEAEAEVEPQVPREYSCGCGAAREYSSGCANLRMRGRWCGCRRRRRHVSSHRSTRNLSSHRSTSKSVGLPENKYVYVLGTEEYIAPEVLRGQKHSFSMDWWSYGVLLYEMIYGNTPFKGESSKYTLRNILDREPEFPGTKTPAKSLIAQLLLKDPRDRLGCSRGTSDGADDIKRHPFFEGVNWDCLQYICRPPFIPPPICLPELEERYSAKLKQQQEKKLSDSSRSWLDQVMESLYKAENHHHSSQGSLSSSSIQLASSSADGTDRKLQRDEEDADGLFSSAEWSSELDLHNPC